jgi:predicted transcriptional regulator
MSPNGTQTQRANTEFRVDTTTGEAYISQRKAAELLGVARTSLQYYLENTPSRPENCDISQGLSSEIFAFTVQYYALEARNPTSEAKALLKQITAAGVKAYLYHMAGYAINATSEIVKPKETEMLGYLDDATVVVKRELELHGLFGTPLHVAQIESVKTTESITGVDFSRFLLNAPAQQGIVDEDVMLEPKELAERLGYKSAIAINKKLIEIGLQSRINGELVATDEAIGMFSKHAWKNGSKSGYNLKWKLSSIKNCVRDIA